MADELSPETRAHLDEMVTRLAPGGTASASSGGPAVAFTNAGDQPPGAPASAPSPAPAPSPASALPNLSPETMKHLASMSGTPDITTSLYDALSPPTERKPDDEKGIVDPYEGMGDWFLAPALWKHLRTSPLAVLGALNADRDSVEGIVKKAVPGAEVKHDNGNLVIRYEKGGQPYVFRTGDVQGSDLLRAGLGTVPYAVGGTLAGAAGTAIGAPVTAGLLATGAVTHGLGALRGRAGGAPASFLEDLGAMGLHGLIHGAGTLAGTIANQGAVAPGLQGMVVPPEGSAIAPTGALGSDGSIRTSIPEVPVAPAEGMPASPPGTAGISGANAPPAPPSMEPGQSGLLREIPAITPEVDPMIQQLVDRADETIRGVTRELDRSEVSSEVLGSHVNDVGRFRATAEAGYKEVDKRMAGRSARTEATLKFIDEVAVKLKNGHADLPGWVRDLYDHLAPAKGEGGAVERPTYHNVDAERRAIGSKLESLRRQGPDPKFTVDKSLAKGIYKSLSADQLNSIPDAELKKIYEAAKASKILQYETIGKIVKLFGKQMGKVFEGDLGPNLENALKPLSVGAAATFRKLAEALPEHLRSDAIMSSIANMFGDVGASEPLQLGKFEKWYRRTMSQKGPRDALATYLHPDAMQGLRGLYEITQQLKGIGVAAAEEKLAKEGELLVAEKALATLKVDLKESRDLANRLAKRALKGAIRAAGKDEGVAASAASLKAGDEAVRDAEAAVVRAREANRKAAQRPGVARTAASFGADALSHHGEKLGVRAYVARKALNLIPDISSSPAFRRLAKAYSLETPATIDLLRRSIAASSGGTVGRLGIFKNPEGASATK